MLSPRAAFGQGEGDRLAVREREGRRCELRLRPVLVGKLVIRENGHAQGFHLGEERRRAARAVEHEGEPVEQGGGRQLRGGGLGGGIGEGAGGAIRWGQSADCHVRVERSPRTHTETEACIVDNDGNVRGERSPRPAAG